MRLPKSIRDNLWLLIAEAGSQVSSLHAFFDTSSSLVAQGILDRSGYVHNLKNRIHDSCLRRIARCERGDTHIASLRAAESIATDLERLTELCRDCIQQMAYLKGKDGPRSADFTSMSSKVRVGIEMIAPAIATNQSSTALKIGHIEHKLDQRYQKLLRRYTAELKKKKHTEYLISALFVAHSLERMGDVLLNISEAIISANLGQPIKIDRYYSLMDSVEQLARDGNVDALLLDPVTKTHSGSGVSGISTTDRENEGYRAIFKEGRKRKLKEERNGVESWHEIYPGLAPKILSYHKRGQSAALLIEHLAGLTFEQILLHEPQDLLEEALQKLANTLESVWRETRGEKKIPAQYVLQLLKRLPDVYAVHPEFRHSDSRVCGLTVPSFDTLLERARVYEKKLVPPFSVYIHGDFNLDNIIYDPEEKRVNFIDLHRSRYMDYVQDVSVFMVSNYRLQVLDSPIRQRIINLGRDFYVFTRKYANKTGDKTFDIRLALGLARSFATSTRFILDKSLAASMFLRARYLIERVLETNPKKAAGFCIPIEEIFVG